MGRALIWSPLLPVVTCHVAVLVCMLDGPDGAASMSSPVCIEAPAMVAVIQGTPRNVDTWNA
eukprot:CAMPEP_0183347856 /NCGR_PEP_ID=MMETSP0164_2-20130417/12546_1 /TAXON_ID=221442 /ORGANISM="Coccolithus pelagicus ssp braarudi, Strain PLY182g" /LENGTH=61 /DNA_ID=CAMNT_0025519353 /DNA_START=519 /DNA_END=704 /DNA_ORIENTATION=-